VQKWQYNETKQKLTKKRNEKERQWVGKVWYTDSARQFRG